MAAYIMLYAAITLFWVELWLHITASFYAFHKDQKLKISSWRICKVMLEKWVRTPGIVGRKKELEILDRLWSSKDFEFLALYGRRRVGIYS